MLEPIQQKGWPGADRRAWSLSLSLFLLVVGFAVFAWLNGVQWTYQNSIEYIPRELKINAYTIGSDLMDLSLKLPDYAFGEYFVITKILPQSFLYYPIVLIFILAFSLLCAGVSYLEDTWLYLSLFVITLGVVLLGMEEFAPFGLHDKWISAVGILVVTGPVYVIQGWFSQWSLARRWSILLLWFLGLAAVSLFHSFTVAEAALLVANLWFPLLIASILFVFMNSTDVLQGMVMLLTKEVHNRQSWMHFTVFSFLYLSNYLLIYLRNTHLLVLDIFYFNPFALQMVTMVFGFWMLDKKSELTNNENQRNTGLKTVYVSLAILFCLTTTLSFGTANDLMVEVLEDCIALIHFCMGCSFFLYMVINFFQLMALGLRVDLVLFKPRYMPVSAIPVFGIAGIVVFQLNEGYFPYYQTLSAKEILLADHARYLGNGIMAENYLKSALSFEGRNQRGNLSLAGLYYEMGSPMKAQQYAEASTDKYQSPEAYLIVSQIYRQKNLALDELLELQEGIRKFPAEGRLLNNIGISFNETIMKDSALHYFSKAAESSNEEQVGKTNLGFYYLVNKLEKDGLPTKTPESEKYGDWAQLNNNLVFANVAGEKAASILDVARKFDEIPESLQPFILYHTYLNKAITRDSAGQNDFIRLENDSIQRYYKESMTIGKAMMKYRCGKTKEGMEELLQLFAESSGRKLELAILLGQLYYDQQAYGSASEYFYAATTLGLQKAYFWLAMSRLDGGRKAEATEAFKEALPHLNPADKIRISILIDGLSSGKFQNAAQRSDPEKSAFLKINWNQMKDKEVKDLIYLVSDKEAQRLLWKYAFDRAYKESMPARCAMLQSFGAENFGKNKKWQTLLAASKPFVLEVTSQFSGLEKLKDAGELSDHPFLLARCYEKAKDKPKAMEYFRKAIEHNPMNTRQMGYSIQYLSQVAETKDLAYQKALELTDMDPGNVEFLKLYALLSVKMGLVEYAYQVLPKISLLTTPQVARDFKVQLDELLKSKNYPMTMEYVNGSGN